jgi:predicted phage terminase large subunit-like protein
VSFAHLQHEGDEYAYYGAQICLLCFDQIEEFSEHQVFYMLGRNRSTCGVRPYCKATCNPLPDSWLSRFLAWWIDEDTGYPIPERAGKTRWFIRLPSDELAWGDSPEHLAQLYGTGIFPKSVAFIPGTLEDNPIGRQLDPAYEANLMLQVGYLRERLRYGNWKARPSSGEFFKSQWFSVVDAAPANCVWVRCWDRAATEPSPVNPDPDWTAGVKIGRDAQGYFYVGDVCRDRVTPQGVESMLKAKASQDGYACTVALLKDPAQAGKMEAEYLVRQLAGYRVTLVPQTSNKETAARPVASQAEAGNIRLIRGDWNETFLRELEQFPESRHDDQVDAVAGGFSVLASSGVAEDLTPAEIAATLAEAAQERSRQEARQLDQHPLGRRLLGGVRRSL